MTTIGPAGIALAGLLLLAAGSAHAQDCADQTQGGLNICAIAAFKKADDRLNAIYRQITARLKDDADTRGLLVAAQRAWLGFRDAECTFLTSPAAQGSIHPMLVAQCREALTLKRVAELAPLLACEEGDMSCPVPAAP
ncbi:lysozyme inhibitor LprI family protein [Ancylobacter terrae]|uniref:lysozyme inhibitor LprI family protein n=1 Tax=Ancylobacter sp. sgz301288 TaxID=3342077 RepID=UPI00385E941F